MSKYFKPTSSEIVEHFKFHSRVQRTGESIANYMYIAELQSLSEYCNFSTTLNEMLRDQLVCGVNDGAIQKLLLSQMDLTYERAMEIALSAETAAQSMQELGSTPESAPSGHQILQEVSTLSASPTASSSQTSHTCVTIVV